MIPFQLEQFRVVNVGHEDLGIQSRDVSVVISHLAMILFIYLLGKKGFCKEGELLKLHSSL